MRLGICTSSCTMPPSTKPHAKTVLLLGNISIRMMATTFRATGAHAGAKNFSSAFKIPIAHADKEMLAKKGKTMRVSVMAKSLSTLPLLLSSKLTM